MDFKVKAIVLKEKDYLNNQKYLDVLTNENGVLNLKLRINGQITKNVFSNVHVCGYYEFSLFCGCFGATINSVDEVENFFDLRFDPEKLALAQYFCELSYILNLSSKKTSRQLKLLLNALWFLVKNKLQKELIKAIFEFKLLSFSGFMPNLVCCKFCYSYEKETMFFSFLNGFLICEDCFKKIKDKGNFFKLTRAVLYAMRFILYEKDSKIFKFKLEEKQLKIFSMIVENFVLTFLEKEPLTLKIYKQFKEEFKI